MYGEGFQEIPYQERAKPPERPKSEAEAKVMDQVAELNIGLELEKHPVIRERLAEIGTHFEDSVDMAKIIRTVYGELSAELGLKPEERERMMRAAVLHDIGKSGPAGTETPFNKAVQTLFVPPEKPFKTHEAGRPKTIDEFMAEQGLQGSEKLRADLAAAGIDAGKESIIDFWRRHAGWSHDILKGEPATDVDADLIKVVASHHLFENTNPAALDIQNATPETRALLEQTEMLAAVDKYQAFRARGGMDHPQTIAQLKKISDARPPEIPQELREKFRKVIDILDKNKDGLEQFFEG